MARLNLTLLGGYSGTFDSDAVFELPTRKAWALLSFLALQPGRAFGRDHLATLFWGDRPDEQARGSLRQTIYEVRSALPAPLSQCLDADRSAVSLKSDELSVDAVRFEALAARDDVESLAQAQSLYGGALLEGLAPEAPGFETWLAAEAARFHELACDALERLAAIRLETGAIADAVETARQAIRIDPLHERAHCLLMQGLAAEGRRGEALRHYRGLEALLSAELGVAPDPETARVRDEILDATAPVAETPRGAEGAGPARSESVTAAPTRAGVRHGRLRRLAVGAVLGALLLGAGWLVLQPASEATRAPVAGAGVTVPIGDVPSIAILPFINLSHDPEQDLIADGLTEDLINTLSKVPELRVIARTSVAKFKNEPAAVRDIAGELGVRYVLEGSVQRGVRDVRISAQLIDAATGTSVWAARFDQPVRELFEFHDAVVRRILLALQVELTEGDVVRIASRGTDSLEAWILRVQGVAAGSDFTPEGMRRARELFHASHLADPAWGRPLAALAWTYWDEAKDGWGSPRDEALDRGIAYAEQAIALTPGDPLGYMQLGNLLMLRGDWAEGLALREKAVELAPNDFRAVGGFGYQLIWTGDVARAMDLLRRGERLSPIYPMWGHYGMGLALHLSDRPTEAIARFERCLALVPQQPWIHVALAAVYADLGRMNEARAHASRFLEKRPMPSEDEIRAQYPFRDEEKWRWYRGLLREAGLNAVPTPSR